MSTLSPKKTAFVLTSTDHGTMIVNRFDYNFTANGGFYGVGAQLLETSSFDAAEVEHLVGLLRRRHEVYGPGVVAIDGGANIGVQTLTWARAMTGWGSVIAIEAQERVFYALAGNIAVNNLFNARAMHAAIAAEPGIIEIPEPDYLNFGTFGSFELRRHGRNEDIGQDVDKNPKIRVAAMTIDSLALPRLDMLKLDIEGMEEEALAGARRTIEACRPVIVIEWIKSDKNKLVATLAALDYEVFEAGINLIGIHKTDRLLQKA